MNFIMRNLGWLLLAGFFVFMLFLISSNNSKNTPATLTGVVSTNSWEEDLDTLVEKLDDAEMLTGSMDAEMETQSWALQEGKRLSLFERFFGKKNPKENKEPRDQEQIKDQEKISDIESNTQDDKNEVSSEEKSLPETTTVEITKPGNSSVWNLVKDTLVEPLTPSVKKPSSIDQTTGSVNIPQGKIGDVYKVAVKSLRLNNLYFSRTLWYLNQGDTLKQKGNQNSNGCFEAEVLSAQNSDNLGKVGYVCQKYLTPSSQTSPENTDENQTGMQEGTTPKNTVLPDLSRYPKTQIGDIITLEKSGSIILKEYTDLATGDQVDQMTNIDAMGCFIAHVYHSSLHTSKDMVGKICLQDIYK